MKLIRSLFAMVLAAGLLTGCAVDVDDDVTTVKPAKVKIEAD